MATIKSIKADKEVKRMESLKGAAMENFSIRMGRDWVEILQSKANGMSLERGRSIKPSDLIRESVFQCWIKPETNDIRESILKKKI